MEKEKTNILERVRRTEEVTRITLKRLLKYTDEDLATMIFDNAIEYLKNIFGTDKHFPHTHEFWSWWKREYAIIDDEFVNAIRVNIDLTTIIDRENPYITHYVLTLKDLRAWYTRYHEASMSNRFITKEVVDVVRRKYAIGKRQLVKEVSHG